MSTPKAAEELLQRVRKLPSNKVCANCGTESRLGFGAVCMKFATFVCDNCKSAHQGFSHLCKSVSMSHWSMDEVRSLELGGNAACQQTWFAKCTAQDRARYAPQPGSVVLEDYKRFVQMAYEEKRWLGTVAASTAAAPFPPTAAAVVTRAAKPSPAPKQQQDDGMMLLDFGSLDAPPKATQSGFAFVQQPPQPPQPQASGFGFVQQPQQPPPPANGFAFIQSAPAFAAAPSQPHYFQPPPPQAAFNDPFAHLSAKPAVVPAMRFNNNHAAPPPPPPQQQFRPPPPQQQQPSANDPFAGLF